MTHLQSSRRGTVESNPKQGTLSRELERQKRTGGSSADDALPERVVVSLVQQFNLSLELTPRVLVGLTTAQKKKANRREREQRIYLFFITDYSFRPTLASSPMWGRRPSPVPSWICSHHFVLSLCHQSFDAYATHTAFPFAGALDIVRAFITQGPTVCSAVLSPQLVLFPQFDLLSPIP